MASLFSKPKTPPTPEPPPPPPPPAPLPDEEAPLALAGRKQRASRQAQRSGRLSTILSEGEGLGG